MEYRMPANRHVYAGVLLAFVLWAVIFGLQVVNFWLGLSVAAALLAAFAIYHGGLPLRRADCTLQAALLGLGCAAVLYGIFALANALAPLLLPFAGRQVSEIYQIRQQAAPGVIAVALLFLTSPCEEIFWRGFLQRWAMRRFGPMPGCLLGAGVYAAVHIASVNLMLTGAALVAGLFWGFVYKYTNNLFICIISHAAWTVAIFLVWPLGAVPQ